MTTVANAGHGHVRPRPDGVLAKCGGPGLCAVCATEAEFMRHYEAQPFFDVGMQALAAIPPDEVPPLAPYSGPPVDHSEAILAADLKLFGPSRVVAPDVWMQALGGVAIDLVNPTPDSICFKTIATVLARIPRFGGHTRNGTYSVAQHCIEGAAAIQRDGHPLLAAAAFLIHDAHEAYIGDITTPVASAIEAMAREFSHFHAADVAAATVRRAIKGLKERLDSAIYPAAGLPWPLPPAISAIVKEYDLRMMVTERDARLDPPPYPWRAQAQAVDGCDLWHWSEGTVAALYLAACYEMLPALAAIPRVKVPLSRNICD